MSIKIYCPYTDRWIDKEESNSEHIIPLSLGGINGLELDVCSQFNSKVGSDIDGKLSNDFLVNMKRTELDIRGHSNKRPSYVAKHAKLADEKSPVRLEVDRKSGLKLWCPVERMKISRTDPRGSKVSFSTNIDLNIRLRFVAKTSLSAGYYTYGELFRDVVKHDELRFIMNSYGSCDIEELKIIKTSVDDQFSSDKSPILQAYRFVCNAVGKSTCIGLVPFDNSLSITPRTQSSLRSVSWDVNLLK